MTDRSGQDNAQLLARLDERTRAIQETVAGIERKLNSDYVSRQEFEPIKKIVYGTVGLILVAVVGALVALVVNRP